MRKSWEIKLEITLCEDKQESNKEAIENAQNEYDSLVEFKKLVMGYQCVFMAANVRKVMALTVLQTIEADCLSAKRYSKGMKELLDEGSPKIVEDLLGGVIRSVEKAMQKRIKKIEDLNEENEYLKERLIQLKNDLQLAEMNESFEAANK